MPKTLPDDLDALSAEELQGWITQIQNQRDALRDVARRLTAAYDKREAEREALRKLEVMSSAEQEALVQAINAKGIASTTKVGKG